MTHATDYPPHWEADVIASDGGTFHVRPIAPTDAPALERFYDRLSQRTRYLRYFAARPALTEKDLHRFTHHDFVHRVGLLALLGDEVIGVARYEGVPGSTTAEVAFVIADAHQGRGIGSALLEHLAAAARERGIQRFMAVVLGENHSMLRVFRDAGYQVTHEIDAGEFTLEFDLAETATTAAVMRERDQRAAARSIRRILFPSSVAVIGASADAGKIGNAVFGHLLDSGFHGTLYPVNPKAHHVRSVRAYPSVLDVPDNVDLAVVLVPAAQVPAVVEQCAEKGTHGLVVMSAGFAERDDEGAAAQRELIATARKHGMRLVGPNCLGVINTDPTVRLNASLAPELPPRGRAGFFCQSGTLGAAVLAEAARRGVGVSTFVSAGNRADVSGNDLLQYWETDESTDLALLYLESFGNPRKFARLARRLGRRKPIVVVRGPRGGVVPGLRHTTVDVPEASLQALFEASGVIRVDTLGDMFDVGLLLASQPLPRGPRIAFVGNSTALGTLVGNACAAEGIPLARLTDLRADSSLANFRAALTAALDDEGVDGAIAVFVPPVERVDPAELAETLRAAAASVGKPVVSTFLGLDGLPGARVGDLTPEPGWVPAYPTPERAVRALARVLRYAAWRRLPPSSLPVLDSVDPAAARQIAEDVLAHEPGGRALDSAETADLLRTVGIDVDGTAALGIPAVLATREDPAFGALVSFGLAGVASDLFGDIAYAAVPLTTADAADLVTAPKAVPLLTGHGGAQPADLDAIADLALRVSALADALPELASCTLDVAALPAGAAVRRARAIIAPATARADTGPRRLPGL